MANEMVRASGGYSKKNVDDAYDDGYTAGETATKVGTAGLGDVLSGKTFTNSSAVGATGNMPNNGKTDITVPARLNTSQRIPAGYHNGNGVISVAAPSGTKTLAGNQTGNVDLTPYDYKYVNASAVYTAGDTAGYNRGYSAGDTAGYNRGYSAGQTAGYNSGYSAGQTAGKNAALSGLMYANSSISYRKISGDDATVLAEFTASKGFVQGFVVSSRKRGSDYSPFSILVYKNSVLQTITATQIQNSEEDPPGTNNYGVDFYISVEDGDVIKVQPSDMTSRSGNFMWSIVNISDHVYVG